MIAQILIRLFLQFVSLLELLKIELLIFVIVVLLCRFHWNRREMYSLARQVPGPVPLPVIGNSIYFLKNVKDVFGSITQMFHEYRSPVRFWLWHNLFYGIYDPDDFEIVLNSQSALEKDDLYRFLKPVGGVGLVTAPLSIWRKHRKIISPTFNTKMLHDFVEVFAEQSTVLVEKQIMKIAGRGTIDIFDHIGKCTLDMICETAMGMKINAQTTDADYVTWTKGVMTIAYTRILYIWFHFDFIFNLFSISRKQKLYVENMQNLTRKIVREKRESYRNLRNKRMNGTLIQTDIENDRKRKTFLEVLLELSEDTQSQFTEIELINEVDTFTVAGTDTSSSVISFVLLMLGIHKNVQQKVYEEAIAVLGPERAVQAEDLCSFKYIEMVIKETMRLFPIAPYIVRKLNSNLKLKTCTLSGGSSVILSILHLHRNEQYWTDPLKFDPDRFTQEQVLKRHPYCYLPFSAGPRNCIGMKYAMLNMKTVIATVVRRYLIDSDYKSVEDIKLSAHILLKPENGFKVSFELRKEL